jgi:RNA recognition motif-containing protein
MQYNRRAFSFGNYSSDDEEQSPSSSSESQTNEVSNRVFIGNLNYDLGWTDIKDHFGMAGTVKFVRVLQTREGASRGMAVVEFESPDEVQAAIDRFDGQEFAGRSIFVRVDNSGQKPRGTKVVVSNLPTDAEWRDLRTHFSADQGGFINYVRVQEDGTAIIEFRHEQDAVNATERYDNTAYEDSTISVRVGEPDE